MKFFSTLAAFAVVFGCGILSAIFGLPKRYIERDVKAEELVGTWNVTPDSESDVNDFVKRFPDWGASAPWKTMVINSDGTCIVEVQIAWLSHISDLSHAGANNRLPCLWRLTRDSSLDGDKVPVIKLDFEYPNDYEMGDYSLYIFEENGELIIWGFIGDPDNFRPQDFVKGEQ